MFKERIVKALARLKKHFKKKESFLLCALYVVLFSMVFVSGIFSTETIEEICANYYSDISLNQTISVGSKKLSGLIVQPKPGHNVSMAYDTQAEINNIWGAFKGEDASFAPVINANKDINISFLDETYSTKCLSILYSSVGSSTEVYHTKKIINEITKKEEIIPVDYKFQCSPLATMFQSARSGMQDQIFIYISQHQAENKLKAEGKQITADSLYSLLGRTTEIDFNGEIRTCIIHNIYLDNFKHEYEFPDSSTSYNYYYGTDVGTILGDYIFISTYALQQNVFPQNLVKQGLYFMSGYSFRNRFFLDYAKECYSPIDYSFEYATSNLRVGFIPNDNILHKAVYSSNANGWCVFLTTLTSLLFVFNFVLIIFFRLYMSFLSIALIGISSIIPYCFFKFLFVVTKNIFVFSSYSSVLNFVLLIVLATLFFIIAVLSKPLYKKEQSDA